METPGGLTVDPSHRGCPDILGKSHDDAEKGSHQNGLGHGRCSPLARVQPCVTLPTCNTPCSRTAWDMLEIPAQRDLLQLDEPYCELRLGRLLSVAEWTSSRNHEIFVECHLEKDSSQ